MLNKFPTLIKDLNFITNIGKNILSQFKNARWGLIEADIQRKKGSLDQAVDKVGVNLGTVEPKLKKNIVDTVRKIHPDCPATRLSYLEWDNRATDQLKSRKVYCELLKHELMVKK